MNGKDFCVLWSPGSFQGIYGKILVGSLGGFLQFGLVVLASDIGSTLRPAIRIQKFDDRTRPVHAAVQKDAAENGFHGIGEQGIAVASPLIFLAAREAKDFVQVQFTGQQRQCRFIDEAGTQTGL